MAEHINNLQKRIDENNQENEKLRTAIQTQLEQIERYRHMDQMFARIQYIPVMEPNHLIALEGNKVAIEMLKVCERQTQSARDMIEFSIAGLENLGKR